MAVDTATYLSQFDAAKPAATDLKSEGDDNFRHIKTVLKATWPNLTAAACTPTTTEINRLVGVTSAVAGTVSPTLTTPVINGYTEGVVTANTTASYTIALTGTIQILTLTAATVTYTFPAAVAGKGFLLVQKQDATGSRTVVWPAAVKWPSVVTPTLTAGANTADMFSFTCDGTSWYGRQIGNDYA